MATDVKPKGNRLLVILGVAAFVAAFALLLALGQSAAGRSSGGAARSVQVVVAAREIPLATQVTKEMVQTTKYAPDQVPPGTFPSVDAVVGKFTGVAIHLNQVLADNLLVNQASDVKAAKQPYLDIAAGQVAIQIPTGEMIGVGGYIQPEDRIDIIVTQDRITKTAFKNLRILRVGPAGSANARGISSSFTVTVSLPEAEQLKYLIENLSYKYVLKSVKDYDQLDPPTPGVTKESFTNIWGLK